MRTTEIPLKPKVIAGMYAGISLMMVVGHIGGRISFHYFDRTYGFYFFDLNREDSIPTFFASMGLFLCSILLFLVVRLVRQSRRSGFYYWLILGFTFLYMAVDETVRIHEKLGGPLRSIYNTPVLFDMVWLVPYGLFAIVFGIAYLRFLFHLPSKTRRLFLISGLVYFTGAAVFEYLGGRQDALFGIDDFGYQAFVVLEEGFEMTGVVIFLYAILTYLSEAFGQLRFTLHANVNSPPD